MRCECGRKYIEERRKDHFKLESWDINATQKFETYPTRRIQSDKAESIHKGENKIGRTLKNLSFIRTPEQGISQPSLDVSQTSPCNKTSRNVAR
jgi:hypothetical protein